MRGATQKVALGCLSLVLAAAACSFPGAALNVDDPATVIAATVVALQTGLSGTQTALASSTQPASAAPPASPTNTPLATAEPKQPLVIDVALCWTGPGNAYPVVSSVRPGTPVLVLGVGSKPGWFVIENPTYRDRCWIEAKHVQLDPFFNVSGLKVYNPPPTPGPTPGPTATP